MSLNLAVVVIRGECSEGGEGEGGRKKKRMSLRSRSRNLAFTVSLINLCVKLPIYREIARVLSSAVSWIV